MKVTIERFITGPIDTNTFVVSLKNKCLIVDPSSGQKKVLAYISKNELEPQAIVITHGHFDHILGLPEIIAQYREIGVYIHPSETVLLRSPEFNGSVMMGSPVSYNGPVKDLLEGTITIGNFLIDVRHVPGHSPGGCALIFDTDALVGDILFAGSIGRSDLPGGDGELLINGIRQKLFGLPDETVVYPGHGNRTTIGREKRSNPYFN